VAEESRSSPHPDTVNAGGKSAQPEVKLPAIPLTDELLYKFLVSEIAGQRGMISVAKEGYMELARQTKDPRVVKRAAEIAEDAPVTLPFACGVTDGASIAIRAIAQAIRSEADG